ncbi:hypothetical protein ACA910_017308 [Epithemia clementina (nom. ined.)]
MRKDHEEEHFSDEEQQPREEARRNPVRSFWRSLFTSGARAAGNAGSEERKLDNGDYDYPVERPPKLRSKSDQDIKSLNEMDMMKENGGSGASLVNNPDQAGLDLDMNADQVELMNTKLGNRGRGGGDSSGGAYYYGGADPGGPGPGRSATTVTGIFMGHDARRAPEWEIGPYGNEYSSFFALQDLQHDTIPFGIAPQAPHVSLFVAADGHVGLGTSIPEAHLHILATSTTSHDNSNHDPNDSPPFIRLQQVITMASPTVATQSDQEGSPSENAAETSDANPEGAGGDASSAEADALPLQPQQAWDIAGGRSYFALYEERAFPTTTTTTEGGEGDQDKEELVEVVGQRQQTMPLFVQSGAPSHSLFVTQSGTVGIGGGPELHHDDIPQDPTVQLHVFGNVRIEGGLHVDGCWLNTNTCQFKSASAMNNNNGNGGSRRRQRRRAESGNDHNDDDDDDDHPQQQQQQQLWQTLQQQIVDLQQRHEEMAQEMQQLKRQLLLDHRVGVVVGGEPEEPL